MPELPEVETIRRDIENGIIGHTILRVEVCHVKSINLSVEEFKKKLEGATIIKAMRKGKLLQCALSSGEWLVVHLKMTGQLIIKNHNTLSQGGGYSRMPVEGLPNKHTRIILSCTESVQLYFNDIRTFGWMHIMSEDEQKKYAARLAPDAYLENIEAENIDTYVRRYPRRIIKQMLLDQNAFASGLGNIYADEVCFEAGVLPTRTVHSLTSAEKGKIQQAIKDILKKAVLHRGTTFRNFVDGEGKKGGFQDFLKVYGQAGQPCKVCSTILARGRVAQRGTVWCEKCQK